MRAVAEVEIDLCVVVISEDGAVRKANYVAKNRLRYE